jgi:peptidoglycan/LPS O-acetylase OafA/YrhL
MTRFPAASGAPAPGPFLYRPHIDGLRAVAVVAVVVYHAFPAALPGGFAGVDVFFVISGFLISQILYREFAAPGARGLAVIGHFYSRRVRRIFPALIVVLAACYALGFSLLLPAEFERLCLHIAGAAGFFVNFLFARETGYFAPEAAANPLLHLWSLGVEEQFYLVWPLAIWLAVRCRVKFLPVAVFLAVFSFCWNTHRPETAAAAAATFFLPQNRLWELLLGAIAAALYSPRAAAGPARPALGNALSIFGLLLIALGLVVLRDRMDLPNAWTLLPTLGTACVVCSEGSAWINRHVLSRRLPVGIGLISYPLYLWHWPLLSFARSALDHPEAPAVKAVAILAAVLLAWLTYLLIESPIRRRAARPRTVALLLGAMLPVAAVSCFSYRREGFPARFPAMMRQLADFNYDASPWKRSGYYLLDGEDETDFKREAGNADHHQPTLYLWGDSHAAGLYPGLEKYFGSRYEIVQRTSANLAPFVEDPANSSTHARINRSILEAIRREKPACVVLEANWPQYEWSNIGPTIAALRQAGIGHIVLVGPLPHWVVSLPQQVCNYVRQHHGEPVPLRLKTGLEAAPMRIDREMAAFSARLGVEYISPCGILGNQDGFLVRVGDSADSLTAYDYGHLTAAGSLYLGAHFPPL